LKKLFVLFNLLLGRVLNHIVLLNLQEMRVERAVFRQLLVVWDLSVHDHL